MNQATFASGNTDIQFNCHISNLLNEYRPQYSQQVDSSYSEELLTPIYFLSHIPFNAVLAQEMHAFMLSNKIRTLFKHFNIDANDPNAWTVLALALAEKHVPGFKLNTLENECAGENLDSFTFYLEVRWIKSEKKCTVKDAIRIWLILSGYQDIEDHLPSKTSTYYHIKRKNKILVENKGISTDKLDQELFSSFPNALVRIRQLIDSSEKF